MGATHHHKYVCLDSWKRIFDRQCYVDWHVSRQCYCSLGTNTHAMYVLIFLCLIKRGLYMEKQVDWSVIRYMMVVEMQVIGMLCKYTEIEMVFPWWKMLHEVKGPLTVAFDAMLSCYDILGLLITLLLICI